MVAPAVRLAQEAFALKSDPSLLEERGVTRREADVLVALAERLTNAEIAQQLYVSERTVESHVSSLLRKLQAGNRLELGEIARSMAAAARGATAALPPALELLVDSSTYVGRTEERARLRALWVKACGGQTLVAVVAGEAGMGKSRLVAEFASEVHRDGGRVLLGACLEHLPLPYQPFAHAVMVDAESLPAEELRHRAGPGAAALARAIPELAGALDAAFDATPVDTRTERAEVFSALYAYLARAAEASPLLLVVEDLHWATATTRDFLRHVARIGGRAPLLVTVATRDAAPDLDEPLASVLADLEASPAAERLTLSGLDEDEVGELVGALGGAGDPARVLEETGGNPLFVRELVGRSWGRPAAGTLSALLVRRFGLLEPDDVEVLDSASVLGAEFSSDVVASMCDRPFGQVLEALERAEGAGLVTASPGRPGKFHFLHALFCTARYESLPTTRRLRLHDRAATVLARRTDEGLVDAAAVPQLARHACLAVPLGDPRAALEYARRAGELAEWALAFDEAAGHYEAALAVADTVDPPDPRARLHLTIRRGEALNRMGDPRYRDVLLDAAARARALDDPGSLADITWAMSQDGVPTNPGWSDPEFVAIAEDALAGLGPEPTADRARTLATLSTDLAIGGDATRAFHLAQEALSIARSSGDPVALGQVLLATRIARWIPGTDDGGHAAADELLALTRSTGRMVFRIYGLLEHALAFRDEGDFAGYEEAIEESGRALDSAVMPHAYVRALLVCMRADRQALTGDLVGAEETAAAIFPLARGGEFDPTLWHGPLLLAIRHAQGRLGEHIAGVEQSPPGFAHYTRPMLALAYAHGGRLPDALPLLRSYAAESERAAMNVFRLTGMVLTCEVAEMTGDAEAGQALAAGLAPFSGVVAGMFTNTVAPVDLALAQAALARGEAAETEALAARAVAASRARRTPVFLGRELLRLAAARRLLGHGDVRGPLEEALAVAERTGAELIRREADRLLA